MNFLRLIRFPGLFTAAADVLAGFFIIRFAGLDYERIGFLPNILASSICLYLAGMVFNDLFDVKEDEKYRPQRPLPSGQVSMTAAFILGTILAIAGLMLAMSAGMATFLTASVLLLVIFAYNSFLKNLQIIGPVAMGACRGLNVFLGMCAHTYILMLVTDGRVFLPPLIVFSYITVVTVLSEMESDSDLPEVTDDALDDMELSTEIELEDQQEIDRNNPQQAMHHNDMRRKHDLHIVLQQNKLELKKAAYSLPAAQKPEPVLLWTASALMACIPLAAGFIFSYNWLSWLITALLLAHIIFSAATMLRTQTGLSVRKTVGAGISGICLLDAALVGSVSSGAPSREVIGVCAVVAGLIIPTTILRRYINLS